MVNTVGSCETKYWQKKWILIKNSLTLTSKQKAVIIGSLLGDGTMRIGRGAKNANFKIEHGLKQKRYVDWKYHILQSFVFTKPEMSYRYRENNEKYPKSWWFRTIRHPILTEIYRRFYLGEGYRNGRKIIPLDIKDDFTPLALAVWIMDDGSYSRGIINISTYSFSLQEIRYLQEYLEEQFKIEAVFYKDRDKGYRMYFRKQETNKLIRIIHPHIISSMMYKIGFATP